MNVKRYKEVLEQLDKLAAEYGFPMFGAAYYYVDSRMSVFADKSHWGILIEVIEVSTGGIGHYCNQNAVYRFGNYLSRPLGAKETRFFLLTSDGDNGPVFDGHLNPNIKTIRLREHLVTIPRDPRFYESKGIKLVDKDKINSKAVLNAISKGTIIVNKDEIWPVELLRALTPEYREYFFLSQEAKKTEFIYPITQILQLEEWRHPLYDENKPTEKPNTHWKNWLIADVVL